MQLYHTTSTYVGRHNVRPSLPIFREGLSDSDVLSVSSNLTVEDSQLWALLQSMLLSKAGVGEVWVWLDVRFSKHSWWVHGDSWRVGWMVKWDTPIGATRGRHMFQLFFLLASGTHYSTPLHCTAAPPLIPLPKGDTSQPNLLFSGLMVSVCGCWSVLEKTCSGSAKLLTL